jgi:hypothetical protein
MCEKVIIVQITVYCILCYSTLLVYTSTGSIYRYEITNYNLQPANATLPSCLHLGQTHMLEKAREAMLTMLVVMALY